MVSCSIQTGQINAAYTMGVSGMMVTGSTGTADCISYKEAYEQREENYKRLVSGNMVTRFDPIVSSTVATRSYLIHPDEMRDRIAALSDRDPLKAASARRWMMEWMTSTFPTADDLYIPSATHIGRSIGEVKLMELGLLNR